MVVLACGCVICGTKQISVDPSKPETLHIGRIKVEPSLKIRFNLPQKLKIDNAEWEYEVMLRRKTDKGFIGKFENGLWMPEPGLSGRVVSVLYRKGNRMMEFWISATCLAEDGVNVEFVDAKSEPQTVIRGRRGESTMVRLRCFSNEGEALSGEKISLEPAVRFKPPVMTTDSRGLGASVADTAKLPPGSYVVRAFAQGKLRAKASIVIQVER